MATNPWSLGGLQAAQQKRATVDAAFKVKYNATPLEYLSNAETGVYGEVASGGAKFATHRSSAGRAHTNAPIVPSDSPSPLVRAYHVAEDASRTAAGKGDLATAIKKLDEAAELREKFNAKISGGPDTAHRNAVTYVQQRRASLNDLNILLKADPKIAAAKLEIDQFYRNEGIEPPKLA
ncbi:hypothetical protein [Sphingomonas sp. Leaf343]|uniref:hypothetical protein n=1 Tax=Sphingomonas sp. Leaf343 TaxID=1736345 RepID=UPI000A426EB2|nr:hypothetical protein [Sphingomonas sp. Leaf343]